ncbi:MAG: hypothetical protein JWP47_3161 [Polaromonas sp.]|jgi:hypothetical protein|nr:hypothetical protein [Polaromonas sp.]
MHRFFGPLAFTDLSGSLIVKGAATIKNLFPDRNLDTSCM